MEHYWKWVWGGAAWAAPSPETQWKKVQLFLLLACGCRVLSSEELLMLGLLQALPGSLRTQQKQRSTSVAHGFTLNASLLLLFLLPSSRLESTF